NNDWRVNSDLIIKECTFDTGLIFLANPNNPTGLLMSQEEIKYLLEHIPSHTLLVLDEAYYEYAASQLTCDSIEWLSAYPNLVITRTFSKIYGLAGLRLGYAIANPSIINILQRVQLSFTVNQLALRAAFAAIDDQLFISNSLKINHDGMIQMKEGFDELGINYLPSACNFLTFNCNKDSLPVYNELLDQGIIVRPLHAYKMANYIRVTIGTKEQNIRFLAALQKCLFSTKNKE
ncbi:MAG: histidinol-phosphate transaminase, partial [bacterium]|nr:histidinol-phosphate transaminase [bacterium]